MGPATAYKSGTEESVAAGRVDMGAGGVWLIWGTYIAFGLHRPRNGVLRFCMPGARLCIRKSADTGMSADFWSRRRESNPREPAWEAGAIPLGDSCALNFFIIQHLRFFCNQKAAKIIFSPQFFCPKFPRARGFARGVKACRASFASACSLRARRSPSLPRCPRRNFPRRSPFRFRSNTAGRGSDRKRACARRSAWGGRGR